MSVFGAVSPAIAAHQEKMVGFKKLRAPLSDLREARDVLLKMRKNAKKRAFVGLGLAAAGFACSIVAPYFASNTISPFVVQSPCTLLILGGSFLFARQVKKLSNLSLSAYQLMNRAVRIKSEIRREVGDRRQASRMLSFVDRCEYPAP